MLNIYSILFFCLFAFKDYNDNNDGFGHLVNGRCRSRSRSRSRGKIGGMLFLHFYNKYILLAFNAQ